MEELPLDAESASARHLKPRLRSLLKVERDKLKLVMMKLIMGATREGELSGQRLLALCAFLDLLRRASRVKPGRIGQGEAGTIKALMLIKDRDPHQLRVRDHDGSLPLRVALKSVMCVHPGRSFSPQRRSCCSVVVKLLLEEHPEPIGMPDQQGWLPPHVAAEQKLPCCKPLASAEARALMTRRAVTRMRPFQLAALGSKGASAGADACADGEWADMTLSLL